MKLLVLLGKELMELYIKHKIKNLATSVSKNLNTLTKNVET